MALETNKTKICCWQKLVPGLYRIGDISVEQIWHFDGACEGQFMWHVIIDGKTVEKWAYLKDAKKQAHVINQRCQHKE